MNNNDIKGGLSAGDGSISGFNIQIPYFAVVRNVFSFFRNNNEGSYHATFRILIEYFKLMEVPEAGLSDNDPYIYLKMELMKIKKIPMFPDYTSKKINTGLKELQYIKLLLRNIGQQFLDLSDAASLTDTGGNDFKGLIHLERIFIEHAEALACPSGKRNRYSSDDLIEYYSSVNTLTAYFQRTVSGRIYPERIKVILDNIIDLNGELHGIMQRSFKLEAAAESLYVQKNMDYAKSDNIMYA